MAVSSGEGKPNERLDGWEQIAYHLGVTPKTAQTYEKQTPALPVHREGSLGMRGRVFAFSAEIDEWKELRHLPPPGKEAPKSAATPASAPLAPPPERLKPLPWAVGATIVIIVLAGAVSRTRKGPTGQQQQHAAVTAPAKYGRIFWRRASESAGPPRRFRLPGDFVAYATTTSVDGRHLYVGGRSKEIYILDAKTGVARTIPLPEFPVALAVDEKRSITYAGAKSGAIMIIDAANGHVLEVIQAGGVVNDLALSPDGDVLFVALLHAGAKRLRLFPSREWTQITTEACPAFVRLDATGDRLMVGYRCGGPGGRPGHDAVEIFDARSGKLLDSLSGPPIVGSEHAFSPDGLMLWISGGDACSSPRYDHQGCPTVPSGVFHLYRLPDRRLIRSASMPLGFGTTVSFLAGGSRVLSLGGTVRVLRASDLSLLESQSFAEPAAGVVSRDGSTVFFMLNPDRVEAVEAEPAACGDLGPGAAQFHAMDGSGADAIENARLEPEEGAAFGPGMVGQALRLSPEGQAVEIRAPSTYRFGARDSTMAMYVKLDAPLKSAPLLEYDAGPYNERWRLSVHGDGRPQFELRVANGVSVQALGKTPLTEGRWRHISVTKSAHTIRIFVDGDQDAEATAATDLRIVDSDAPVRLGWSAASPARLSGYLDEVAMWDRELTTGELKHLVSRRLSGICKP